MKTKLSVLLIIGLTISLNAQKYISKTGHIWFYSYTPIESIEAHNHQSVSILDATTGDIQFSLLIRSFEFKVALMQEHFNVNYMESEVYPKAGFKGKISNLIKIDFSKDGKYPIEASGELIIHGVTKPVTATGSIEIKGGAPMLTSKFKIVLEDYKIMIPDMVKEKIAKEVEITVEIDYSSTATLKEP